MRQKYLAKGFPRDSQSELIHLSSAGCTALHLMHMTAKKGRDKPVSMISYLCSSHAHQVSSLYTLSLNLTYLPRPGIDRAVRPSLRAQSATRAVGRSTIDTCTSVPTAGVAAYTHASSADIPRRYLRRHHDRSVRVRLP